MVVNFWYLSVCHLLAHTHSWVSFIGIGYETACDFAKRGAKVILACRSEEKAKKAVEKIVKNTQNYKVSYRLIDFSDNNSIRNCAQEIIEFEERLDILVNNAGAIALSGKSVDGHNLLMQTNYFGPFLFTVLLLDLIQKTPNARIINVSSMMAKQGKMDLKKLDEVVPENRTGLRYSLKLYSNTKLCNVMFTVELANRLKGTGVTTYSVNPGVVDTEIFRVKISPCAAFVKKKISSMYFKTPQEGCQTTLYCALHYGLEQYNGEHFENCHFVKRYPSVTKALEKDPQIGKKLWELTEKLVGLKQ